jgi:hypothetical protein
MMDPAVVFRDAIALLSSVPRSTGYRQRACRRQRGTARCVLFAVRYHDDESGVTLGSRQFCSGISIAPLDALAVFAGSPRYLDKQGVGRLSLAEGEPDTACRSNEAPITTQRSSSNRLLCRDSRLSPEASAVREASADRDVPCVRIAKLCFLIIRQEAVAPERHTRTRSRSCGASSLPPPLGTCHDVHAVCTATPTSADYHGMPK